MQTPSAAMPQESLFPPCEIPEVDIWGFLFERKDRDFPDDKGAGPRSRARGDVSCGS